MDEEIDLEKMLNNSADQQEKQLLPVDGEMTNSEYIKWLERVKFASEYHRKELVPKYKIALKRYNSEKGFSGRIKDRCKHDDVNILFKDVSDFVASTFFRNPEIDLTSRNTQDRAQRIAIENLQQLVNDDIKDTEDFKPIVRSAMVDESLSSIGAVYLDYAYDDEEAVDDLGMPYREVKEDKPCLYKIRPENVIRPPYQQFYNHRKGPYLGYVSIESIEELQQDQSLDQDKVAELKGSQYSDLMDKDLSVSGMDKKDMGSDSLFVQVYYVFIRDFKSKVLYRLVMADEKGLDGPLSWGVWDKGHGVDGDGYPIYILQLNEPANGFLAPSEAWMMENLLETMDYIFQKITKHLKKSSTRTFVKTGQNKLLKAELLKIARNKDAELIGLENIPAEMPIGSMIQQIVDQPLSMEHTNHYMLCKNLFDELSRQPSFSGNSALDERKTATETQAIQSADSATNGDYVDKVKDWFVMLLGDWARLRQRNMQSPQKLTVESKQGQEEMRDIGPDDIQGEFNADINITSFVAPNKEVKRRIIKETLVEGLNFAPALKQAGYQQNVKRLVEQYYENADLRNPDELIIEIPIRTIDQQITDFVFKSIPFNPQELGGDIQKNFERALEVFQDDQLMQAYESIQPVANEEIAKFVAYLADEAGVQTGAEGGQPKKSEAQTDVGLNASENAQI